MPDLYRLSATEAVEAITAGRITSTQLVEACLNRISEREPHIQAWTYIDGENALKEAKTCDAELKSGAIRGPIHGIPVGVKDVIDVAGMPTEHGSKVYQGNRAKYDAAAVALIRRAGGIVLGKTVTTEFAMFEPNKTRNPHNTLHTPGGSSSGSAAAVADNHVPVALATQTAGSIIKPAAFCGVIGYKPSFDMFSPFGIKPQAPSLDTLGVMARSTPDLRLIWDALQCGTSLTERTTSPHRLAICRTPFWEEATEDTHIALTRTAQELEEKGFQVSEVEMPVALRAMNDHQVHLMAYEAARNFIYESQPPRRGMLGQTTLQSIDSGWKVTPDQYLSIRAAVREAKNLFEEFARDFDAIMVPSAPGEAPLMATTGNSIFNRMWTLLGVPAITIPIAIGSNSLPLGAQFIGQFDSDVTLIEFCSKIQSAITVQPVQKRH